VTAGEQFIASFDEVQFRREVATARLIAGECRQVLGQHQAALPHYQWIISAYAPDETMWPGMNHLARTYYRMYDALLRGGAPPAQWQPAADAVLTLFPNSLYAQLVTTSLGRVNGTPPPAP
jgi:hypothetical protein